MKISGFFFISILALVLVPSPSKGAWFEVGNAVCDEPFSQYDPSAAPDGAGGAVIVWSDQRAGVVDKDIYAQRISSDGELLWGEGGIALCTTSGTQDWPKVFNDGGGGFIVYWIDDRADMFPYSQIYVQRLDADGNRLWASGGLLVSGMIWYEELPGFAIDSEGSTYFSWTEERPGVDRAVFAQKVLLDGTKQWGAEGTVVCDSLEYPYTTAIAPESSGGAIVSWSMYLYDVDYPASILSQRLDQDGNTLWPGDGVQVYTEVDKNSDLFSLAGIDGAWLVWRSYLPLGGDTKIDLELDMAYIDTLGAVSGGPATGSIAFSESFIGLPVIGPVGAEDLLVVWSEDVAGNQRVLGQRIDRLGNHAWGSSSLSICPEPGDQYGPVMTGDGAGGYIIAWTDMRYGGGLDIYSQKIDAAGARLWGIAGKPVTTYTNVQDQPALAADGTGGAIIAWRDQRELTQTDIYAGKIASDGGMVDAELQSWSAVPGAEGIAISWRLSQPAAGGEFLVERAGPDAGQSPAAQPWSLVGGVSQAGEDGSFAFVDASALPGEVYRYRVLVIEDGQARLLFESGEVGMPPASIELAQNRPNPFNPSTVIEFSLPSAAAVRIEVYDAAGRYVSGVFDGVKGPGRHSVLWDGRDGDGAPVSSGVYFYTLRAGKTLLRKKMVLLR